MRLWETLCQSLLIKLFFFRYNAKHFKMCAIGTYRFSYCVRSIRTVYYGTLLLTNGTLSHRIPSKCVFFLRFTSKKNVQINEKIENEKATNTTKTLHHCQMYVENCLMQLGLGIQMGWIIGCGICCVCSVCLLGACGCVCLTLNVCVRYLKMVNMDGEWEREREKKRVIRAIGNHYTSKLCV